MPWKVQGTAVVEVGYGSPGAVELAQGGKWLTRGGAVRGWAGRAGRPVERGRCGSCFTCGSLVAAIPPWVAIRSHASIIAA